MQTFEVIVTLVVQAPNSCAALDFALDLATLAERHTEAHTGVVLDNLARAEVHPVVGVAA